MRIRIVQNLGKRCIDGVPLEHFVPGCQYDVPNWLGALMLAERWAEPVPDDDPALLVPLGRQQADVSPPSNLTRETCPPYLDDALAADLERRKRRRQH